MFGRNKETTKPPKRGGGQPKPRTPSGIVHDYVKPEGESTPANRNQMQPMIIQVRCPSCSAIMDYEKRTRSDFIPSLGYTCVGYEFRPAEHYTKDGLCPGSEVWYRARDIERVQIVPVFMPAHASAI